MDALADYLRRSWGWASTRRAWTLPLEQPFRFETGAVEEERSLCAWTLRGTPGCEYDLPFHVIGYCKPTDPFPHGLLCVILHNLIYGLFQSFFEPGGDEPFFFLLAMVVIPLYTIACLVYSIARLGMWWARGPRTS